MVACGSRLHVTYDAVEPFPVRTEAAWSVALSPRNAVEAVIDAVLTVGTENLRAQPRFSVRSEVTVIQVLVAEAEHPSQDILWKPWTPRESLDQVNSTIVLLRLPGGKLSYLEIAHPADCHSSSLVSHGQSAVRLERTLFASTLEKGVILRARLRGVLLDRVDDTAHAASTYAEFIESEPPLGR